MLTIKIKTDNQAFVDNFYDEIERCLNNVLEKIDDVTKEGNIHDTNGNVCGTFKIT